MTESSASAANIPIGYSHAISVREADSHDQRYRRLTGRAPKAAGISGEGISVGLSPDGRQTANTAATLTQELWVMEGLPVPTQGPGAAKKMP
jgi:hypothetical protein